MSLPPPSADRWRALEALVDVALALTPDERRRFLDDPATGDAELRAELAHMVAECEQTGALLDHPAAERFASLWSDDGDLGSLQAAIADRYTIQQQLGRGGMGTVFRAHDLRHDRPVALKVLHDALSAAVGEQRFRREIRTAARLQHPHILPVFDSGDATGRLWFTMPLVDGETLRDRLVREPQLPLADALRIACEMAAALEYAHRQGVIHRDVKPENVLLTAGAGDALLADFGIARSLKGPSDTPPNGTSSTLTAAGVSIGTPAYMSPEQASGDADVDGRADVYSLGAVLYEMLAGAPVYSAVNARALMARHALDPIPSVCVVRPGVPTAVDAAIQRALAKTPPDRFASAGAFAAALAAVDQTPLSGDAPAPNVGHSLAPVWRRPRFIALTAAIMAVVLAAAWGVQRSMGSPKSTGPATAVIGQPLTFSGWARQPAFSPDGRQLLYVERTCDGTGVCVSALTVRDIGSDQSAILVKGDFIVRPKWSPDGATIAFSMQNGEESGTYLLPRLGGVRRRVGPIGTHHFSANGDTLSVVEPQSTKAGFPVHRVRPATGAPIDSGFLSLPLTVLQNHSWSPDRRWITAYGFGPCGNCLLLASPDGRVSDSVAVDPVGGVRWDPRGNAVYAVVPAVGINAWFVRVAIDPRRGQFGQRIDTLFSVPAVGLGQFDIAPDGRSMVYAGGTTTTTVWALVLNDSAAAPLQLATTTSYLGSVALTSDGELVAYATTDRLGDNIYVKPFAGGAATPVTQDSAATAVYATLGWYPRSHRLAYVAWSGPERRSLRYLQDVPHGTPRRILGPGPGITTFNLLADGGVAEYDEQRVVTFRDSAGKEAISVTFHDSLGALVSAAGEDIDGTGVLFAIGTPASKAATRLVRVDRRSGRVTLIGTIPNPGVWITTVFGASAAGAMYATWPRGARTGIATLWRIAPGHPNTRLRDLPVPCDAQSLIASSDGKRLVCTSSVERPDIFLLEQFDRYRP